MSVIPHTSAFAGELCIVGHDLFGPVFEEARREDSRIGEATSEFSHVDGTIYRLSADAASGYAVRPSGDLVYVFSRIPGRGASLVSSAITDGAETLDCFAGYLPTFYGRHGFVEYAREPNWTPGGPDVVFMATPERLATRSADIVGAVTRA